MEQKRHPRNEPTLTGTINLQIGKGGKNIKWAKGNFFNKLNRCMQKAQTGHFLTPCTIINSKWIKDLNIRSGILKLLENIGSKLFDITLIIIVFKICLLRQGKQKVKTNIWDLVKLKSFCPTKEASNEIKIY